MSPRRVDFRILDILHAIEAIFEYPAGMSGRRMQGRFALPFSLHRMLPPRFPPGLPPSETRLLPPSTIFLSNFSLKPNETLC